MSGEIRVFVNEQAVRVRAGATVQDAVAAFDAALARALAAGGAHPTDGVGRTIAASDPVFEGAIVRVIVSARHHRHTT